MLAIPKGISTLHPFKSGLIHKVLPFPHDPSIKDDKFVFSLLVLQNCLDFSKSWFHSNS